MVDVQRLAQALRKQTTGEVRFDDGARAAYSYDASNYRQVPLGVVLPKHVDDIVAALAVCREHGAPVLARGGGTAQSGQGVNVGVVIDCSKYLHRVLSVDARSRTARVEPGAVCDALRDAAEREGLTFAPDPATHSRCTLGGMIGNNSCGPHSLMAGKTVENTERLEVLTYDGARFWCGETRSLEGIAGRQLEIYSRLKSIADKANAANVPVTLCGELASRPLEAMALIGLGFRQLSMTPAAIGPVKAMLLEVNAAEVEALVARHVADASMPLRPALREHALQNGVPL